MSIEQQLTVAGGSKRGRFLSIEGGDGSGKSSQAQTIVSMLEARSIDVLVTREPGGTPLAERLRASLLSDAMSADTELLLMFAARFEHVATMIEPALAAGKWVVCDRFVDSSFAYQVRGKGVDRGLFDILERKTRLQPDLTLFFDLPEDVAQARRRHRGDEDRFEREAADFHRRVACGFRERMWSDFARFRVINAALSLEDVTRQVRQIITHFIEIQGDERSEKL